MSTKRKLPQKLGQPMVKQSAKPVGKDSVDDSRTVVSGGGNAIKANANGTDAQVISISSDSESGSEAAVEEEGDEVEDEDDSADDVEGDVTMTEAVSEPADPDAEEDNGEPSFGDLVRTNAPSDPIDVAGAFEDPSAGAVVFAPGAHVQTPSGASLGTVLTQALKTNDVGLLESCLHTTDLNTIRATIQRLDSPLASTLLQKLAERLHRRPGRAGSLMVWVQWTLVTHGGYLATQRDLITKLAGLNRVLDERAKGLQSLLALKGKLDMLEAQIELRRSMQNQRRQLEDEEDDEAVIYVEGEDSEDDVAATAKSKRLAARGDFEDVQDDESEVSDDMPMTNGVIADSEDEDEEDNSSDDDGLLDDEAEETDADTGGDDEDEVDHDDQDSADEDDESDDGNQAAPPTKMPRTSGLYAKRR